MIAALGLAAVVGSGVVHAQIKLNPGVVPGKVLHNPNARNFAFCEIAPVLGEPPTAQFYNTSGAEDYCPVDKMEALNPEKLAAELGATMVYLNPTPRNARRHWVMDELWAFAVGESVDFHGVRGTWAASMAPQSMKGLLTGPYTPGQIHRQSKYLYKAGSRVFLLHAPDGKTWVMQSYATEVDRSLTFDQLPQLGSKLKLPAGFRFEAKTLTKDLTINPTDVPNHTAHIMRDDLHNVYEGCGFDNACSYIP